MPITFEMVATAVPIIAFVLGIWWKVENRIDNAKARAEASADSLMVYKTHVAETYVSKQGLREVRDEILSAVENINSNVARINDRIDRFSDQPGVQTRRRTNDT